MKQTKKSRRGTRSFHNATFFAAVGVAAMLSAASAAKAVVFTPGPSSTQVPSNGYFSLAAHASDSGVGFVSKSVYSNYGDVQVSTAYQWQPVSGALTAMPTIAAGPYDSDVSVVLDVNRAGLSVGTSQNFSGTRGVRWSATGTTLEQLGTLGNTSAGIGDSRATSLNSAGTAVGQSIQFMSSGQSTGYFAVRWNAGSTTAINLGSLAGASGSPNSIANDINDAGVIAGNSGKYSGSTYVGERAVRWSAGSTTPTELGLLDTTYTGVLNSHALVINSAGTILGDSDKFDSVAGYASNYPVRWDGVGTTPTQLNSLHLYNGYGGRVSAVALNDAGTVVGASDKYDDANQFLGYFAVRWNPGTQTPIQLGTVGTSTIASGYSYSKAISNTGVVVGASDKYDTAGNDLGTVAVYWLSDNVAVDLNTFLPAGSGWMLRSAQTITDTGWITGYGLYDPDGPGGQTATSRPYSMLIPQIGSYGSGDANFDLKVDFNDLLLLAKHYNQASGGSTAAADFDLNGVTDFNDLLILAKHYNGSFGTLAASTSEAFADDYALARSLVPEPTAIAGLFALGGAVRRRR